MSMPSCCNRMRQAKTRITMLITALHSGQLPPSSATRRAQFSTGHQGKAFHRCQQTYFTTPDWCVCTSWRSWHRRCGRRAGSSRCQLLGVVVVGTVGVLAGQFSSLLYSPPSLTETTCLLLTYVLNLGVNAVDHTVPSNNSGLTVNAYVCSWVLLQCVIFQSVIFQSCKFQSCKFSYPACRYTNRYFDWLIWLRKSFGTP